MDRDADVICSRQRGRDAGAGRGQSFACSPLMQGHILGVWHGVEEGDQVDCMLVLVLLDVGKRGTKEETKGLRV